MSRLAIVVAGMGIALAGCVSNIAVEQVETVEQKTVEPFAEGEVPSPLQFQKIVVKLPRGERIGTLQAGVLCIDQSPLTWRGGKMVFSDDEFTEVFREELEKANCPVVGDSDALFDDPSDWKAELLVAGLVKEMAANICYPYSGMGDSHTARGSAFMKVDWQVYSRLRRRVVYEVSTEGVSNLNTDTPGGDAEILLIAFAMATDNLLADEGFRRTVAKARQDVTPSAEERLQLACLPEHPESLGGRMNTIRAGVVTVFAGEGHGSGFFISTDGHLLTNEHVVRDASFVTIKLITGREMVGEVLRTNAARDVALVKVEEGDVVGLPIRRSSLNVGDDVYAVGSPIDEEFSATVTRGVVSAFRTQDELQFIQSDVNILPGSSGGPLLDDHGNVAGLAVSILFVGAPSGLSFFVPIDDALEALNVALDQ